jgi:hypothetical protein
VIGLIAAAVRVLIIPYSSEILPEPAPTYLEAQNLVYRESDMPTLPETPLINEPAEILASSSIPEMIAEKAKEKGVDPALALLIAKVESGFEPTAKNKESSASGVFQFISQTWKDNCEGDPFDPEANIGCALELLSRGEIGHWTADPRTARVLRANGFIR